MQTIALLVPLATAERNVQLSIAMCRGLQQKQQFASPRPLRQQGPLLSGGVQGRPALTN